MSWLIATLAVAFALTLGYWSLREVDLRGRAREAARRRREWDHLDDLARRRWLDSLNPVDPREVPHDAA